MIAPIFCLDSIYLRLLSNVDWKKEPLSTYFAVICRIFAYTIHSDSLQKGAKANSAQEKRKEKSIRDREKTQGETAGEEEETDWEEAGKERREDA